MRRITWNLESNSLSTDGQVPGDITAPSALAGTFAARFGGCLGIDLAFVRPSVSNSRALDLGSAPGLAVTVKKATGTNRYDDPPLLPSPGFTRVADTLTPIGTFTADDASKRLTFETPHGKRDNDPVQVSSETTLPAGLAEGSIYYVRDCSPYKMRLAAIPGGAAINIDAGTGEHSMQSVDSVIYRASLSLSEPILAKMLGIDCGNSKEQVSIQCIADVAGSLAGKYFDLYTAAATYLRIWFKVSGTGAAPAAGTGGTLVEVDFANDATAATIATAIGGVAGVTAVFDVSVVADTVTVTSKTIGARGYHHPQSSGFTLTLLAVGATAYAAADEDSIDLEMELSHSAYGDLEIADHLGLTVLNSFTRSGVGFPVTSGGNVRQGSVEIPNGADEVTVDFPVAFPGSDYVVEVLRIVNQTDVSPDAIGVGTVTEQDEEFFTVNLIGETTSSHYLLYYKCVRYN